MTQKSRGKKQRKQLDLSDPGFSDADGGRHFLRKSHLGTLTLPSSVRTVRELAIVQFISVYKFTYMFRGAPKGRARGARTLPL